MTDVKNALAHADKIVPVTGANIDQAALIHSRSWQDSHRHICTADFLALHSPEHQRDYLSDEMKTGARVFMLIHDRPVGVVSVRGSLIENLYILPEAQNRGFGSALLEYAIRQCPSRPTLWILENNSGAQRLYERRGFRLTGRRNRITDSLFEVELCLE